MNKPKGEKYAKKNLTNVDLNKESPRLRLYSFWKMMKVNRLWIHKNQPKQYTFNKFLLLQNTPKTHQIT